MVAFTNNGVYVISFTDIGKGTISIPKEALITNRLDITLIGKSRLDYGQLFDENVLHLLENFAAYEDPSPSILGTVQPDLSQATSPLLQNPTEGQFWFNKGKRTGSTVDTTHRGLYTLDASNKWNAVKLRGNVSGNSGIIAHGQQIPLPVGVTTYAECSWFVSPQYINDQANYIACYTDDNANVTAMYRPIISGVPVNALANYIIIGNKASSSHYDPIVSVTPTLTAAMVQSLTPTVTTTPTPTPAPGSSVTPTPTVSPTPSPTASGTPTITPTLTRTITPTFSPTLTPSPINYQTIILNSAFNNANPGLSFVEYGSVHLGDVDFGSYSPQIYNGYQIVGIECYSERNIPPTLGFYIQGAPKTAFTKIGFVDKFGIFREFTSASAQWNGNGFFTWPNIPALLFDTNVTYQILVTP